ncbi:hypothetical protein FB192DRAFT_1341992 [Mucor lusitanicus]|uniref:Uncharacterized protein n=1 Tax=Mucor circinelloides f. lusitanicus TaxID=29924 RepID=A0A8H4BHK5_MUCCL|nr:hypothetical protein FB192DRAFT_1341992 [Mucor lusitanicus]
MLSQETKYLSLSITTVFLTWRWGEKRIATGDGEDIIFKLDAKLVLLYDHAEYPVCAAEFAPYAGLKRIKTDRSKLLVEAKVICDKIMNLELSEEQAALLSVVNVQVVGLETSTVSVKLVDNHLYAANTISSYTLPSTVSQLKQHCKDVIGQIFDLKVD